jgi:hypothetical protein
LRACHLPAQASSTSVPERVPPHLRARPDGKVVLQIPVAGSSRVASAMECVGRRKLGSALVEKFSAMAPAQDGWWDTHWRFRVSLNGDAIHEVDRTFHWYAFQPDEALALVASGGLRLTDTFGTFEAAPFVAGESRTLLAGGRPH